MRLALPLLAALLGASAQPAAVARAAARAPIGMLALDLLPSPTFTIQSFDGMPRPASDDKLRAYCKVLHTRTPGVCFAAGDEGDFARSLCPDQCSASSAATRTLLAANATQELKPCSQTADTSDMCSFFVEQAEGACATAGFLSVYMRSECRKSCQLCTPDSPAEAPKAPVVERPPEPACDKVPDAGSACPFFFSNLVNPCSVATAGDAWIANYTSTQCQTSCGICANGQQPAEPSPASPEPSPSPEQATPSPSPASTGSSDCADLSTASFSCADVVKQELCGQAWAAGWCPKSCGYCDPEQPSASPVAEQPAPASPAAEEQPAASPADQPAPASPAAEEQPPASPVIEEPVPASPAAEGPVPASPAAEQPTPATPAAEEQPATSPAEQPAPASPAPEDPVPTSPAADEQPAASPADQPAPASPAAEEQPAASPAEQPAPASPAGEEPVPASPAAEEPVPASPAAEEPAPTESPATHEPAPLPSAPGGYGASPAPGGYGTSPAPSAPSASPSPAPPSFEPRLTTAAVCQALACLTLPPSGDRLLTLPGIAACPATPCRSPIVDCPAGCSAHGACHVAAGACVCFEGYEGADCASCAAGYEHTASGTCSKPEVVDKAAQAPAPIRPLFGGAEAATGRHLMAAVEDAATITAVENQLVGMASTEKLALALPSGWIAGAVVGAAVGMVAVAALMALRGRSSGGLPL